MRLLNIVSSPRGAKSVSIAVANAFLDAYGKTSDSIEVDTLNVWKENLPDFDSRQLAQSTKEYQRSQWIAPNCRFGFGYSLL